MIEMRVYSVAKHGLPPTGPEFVGRVAFIYYGSLISGWCALDELDPSMNPDDVPWEAVHGRMPFYDVAHWVLLPKPLHIIDDGDVEP